MHDEAAFLQAIQEHPADTALRLVFADWLEERGDVRGELIRLLHTLTQPIEARGRKKTIEVHRRKELESRLRGLVACGFQAVGPFFTNSIGMKFAWIPPGTFEMGSPNNEGGRDRDERQHRVTLTKGFYLAIHPVAQASWREIMGNPLSSVQGDDLPVDQAAWLDGQMFLRSLSERDGHAYRFPTEAEWEYACRAGTTTPFSVGETISQEHANFNNSQPSIVGSFLPNGWGLHDMHGNVWEWCADWHERYSKDAVFDPTGPETGRRRVLRGGSFTRQALHLRSASRLSSGPAVRVFPAGFRPAMTPP